MRLFRSIGKVLGTGEKVTSTFSNQAQASKRHETDMLSDNRLSKNIRPLIIIWLMCLATAMIVCDMLEMHVADKYQTLINYCLIMAIAFYFPGRTAEKYIKERRKEAEK